MRKQDNINDRTDTLSFDSRTKYDLNQEVEIYLGVDKIFGGVIVQVRTASENKAAKVVKYSVTCKDFSHYLGGKLVVERYSNTTVGDIIRALILKYGFGFTTVHVDCDVEVDLITFDNISILECLNKLADLTGYSWYVDYGKDTHFFAKNTEMAPFHLTDTNGNYIFKSLEVTEDMSQLRNRIKIKGGEYEGIERTETQFAPADADERKFVRLANKFAHLPVVEVNDVPYTVGVDFIQEDANYQVMWDFNQKYLRWTAGNETAEGDKIEVTGIPLYRLVLAKSDGDSIIKYGRAYEFLIEDVNIVSRQEALSRASAELQAYADNIIEGSFQTTRNGLRSGQVIHIQSDLKDIDEDFIIQSVTMTERTPTNFMYDVKLATLRTMGIIDVLQKLLRKQAITEAPDSLLQFVEVEDEFFFEDTAEGVDTTTGPYQWSASTGSLAPAPIRWNYFTWGA